MSVTGFAVDSIDYSICNFIQFGNFRINFHTYGLLSSHSTVFERFAVGSTEYSLCIYKQLACFRLTIHNDRIELLYSPACRKRRLMEEGA